MMIFFILFLLERIASSSTISFSSCSISLILFKIFTNQCQVYKAKVDDFTDTKASVLGEYVPGKLEMAEDEQAVYTAVISDYTGYMIFVFENGKLAKVDMASYATKTNRKKLINAYSNKSPLAQAIYIKEDTELVICSSSGRMLLVNTGAILPKDD